MTTITLTREIVLNTCYGGYGLSNAAAKEVATRHGIKLVPHPSEKGYFVKEGTFDSVETLIARDDPHLVAVVREMGDAASGKFSDLRIHQIKITIDISNYDGRERVQVTGRAD